MTTSPFTEILLWFEANPLLLALLVIWVIIWKGLALWKSAGLRQRNWFIAILLINTFGILEIIYIFLVANKYKVEIIEKNE